MSAGVMGFLPVMSAGVIFFFFLNILTAQEKGWVAVNTSRFCLWNAKTQKIIINNH